MAKLRLLISLSLMFAIVIVGFSQPAPNPVFETLEHDFGDLKEGEKREFIYKFQNEGDAPFVISTVHVQCGCTAPEWPKEPILPKEKGQIKILYNSAGKEGIQRKVITLESNAGEQIKLKVIANVITD